MAVSVFTFSDISLACSTCGCRGDKGVSVEKGEVINSTCPVMGGKVDKDTPYRTEYKGKTVGFCCPGCIATFNKDPEGYLAKIETKECVIECPECGAKIDMKKKCKEMGGACPMTKE
ncbi:MAG: YHS domain-containing protein [Candidatus Omnitrophica bacterium]|nr:YHS domain-containing protein [Candidatus Omnitrophota bacterium]